MNSKINAIAVSNGIAAGKTWVQKDSVPSKVRKSISMEEVPSELEAYKKAKLQTILHLQQLALKVEREQSKQASEIFRMHIMLLEDESFGPQIEKVIAEDKVSAVSAVESVSQNLITMFDTMDNDYFKERALDIKDISRQLKVALLKDKGLYREENVFPQTGKYIIVAEELTPAQTVKFPIDRVLGFVMTKGGNTSHAAILARTYGVPAVIVKSLDFTALGSMEYMAINGYEGWISPISREEIKHYQARTDFTDENLNKELNNITLAANIGSSGDIELIKKYKAEGVGLFRTEFLFMGESLPSEEEQINAYRAVIEACEPHMTIIRTLDIGGDKEAPALELPKEKNPFLGVRALRLCFANEGLFKVQLRAIWKASYYGSLAVMFPMVANLAELRKAKSFLREAKDEVIKEGFPTGNLQTGIMIEIPSAVLLADCLAKEVDFFSIGTNDLTQYTMAADRENEQLTYLNEYYQPAVLKLISMTVEAARQNNIWVGICGEAGGDELLLPFWSSLGVTELSMSPGKLTAARKTLNTFKANEEERKELVKRVLSCVTTEEIKICLVSFQTPK